MGITCVDAPMCIYVCECVCVGLCVHASVPAEPLPHLSAARDRYPWVPRVGALWAFGNPFSIETLQYDLSTPWVPLEYPCVPPACPVSTP
jgi:hypothetical protein